MIPSIGIILTEKCDFNCIYCPPYGENITKTKGALCNIDSLLHLIDIARDKEVKVIRFTGGEPLFQVDRLKKLMSKTCSLDFQKVILNTNGVHLLENLNWLKKYKNQFLLKISLDTLDAHVFTQITNATQEKLKLILNAIDCAINMGFSIEINTVANIYNHNELFNVVDYCISKKINLKVFDIFDFGEYVVNYSSLYVSLDNFINEANQKFPNQNKERLPGGRGIEMTKFQITESNHMLVVCHEGKYSSTKKYTSNCSQCKYYPCKTGKFQIPIRADGLMQTCRLMLKDSINISNLNYEQIKEAFNGLLEEFQSDYIL